MLRLFGFFGNFFLGPWLVVLGMWSHHPGIRDLGAIGWSLSDCLLLWFWCFPSEFCGAGA